MSWNEQLLNWGSLREDDYFADLLFGDLLPINQRGKDDAGDYRVVLYPESQELNHVAYMEFRSGTSYGCFDDSVIQRAIEYGFEVVIRLHSDEQLPGEVHQH